VEFDHHFKGHSNIPSIPFQYSILDSPTAVHTSLPDPHYDMLHCHCTVLHPSPLSSKDLHEYIWKLRFGEPEYDESEHDWEGACPDQYVCMMYCCFVHAEMT